MCGNDGYGCEVITVGCKVRMAFGCKVLCVFVCVSCVCITCACVLQRGESYVHQRRSHHSPGN